MNGKFHPLSGAGFLPRRGPSPYAEITYCLSQLRRSWSNTADELGWPRGDLMDRLHKGVNEIAKRLRRRQFDDPWKAYLCVNRHRPKLQLLKVLGIFLRRCFRTLRSEVPIIPQQTLIWRIKKTATRKDGTGDLARELLNKLGSLNTGRLKPHNLDWGRFEPLLRHPGINLVEIGIGDCSASIDIVCYCRSLEGLLEYRQLFSPQCIEDSGPVINWLLESAARCVPTKECDLVPDIVAYQLVEPTDGLANERENRKKRSRASAAECSRRYRARKRSGKAQG